MIDIVQVNIYGQTLSEMLQKGVDIPHWLESFGIEHCVVFDVPWTSCNGEMSVSPYGSSNSSDCSLREDLSTSRQFLDDTVKVEQEEINEAAEQVNVSCSTPIRVTNTGLTSALLNCSFSSIRRDGYLVGELNENFIAHEDSQELEFEDEFSLPLKRQAEVVQMSRFDLLTFSDSVMDVVLDLLDNVENQALCSKGIARLHSSDETVPCSKNFSKSFDYGVSVQDVESVDYISACDNSSQLSPTSHGKNVSDKNTTCLPLKSLCNASPPCSDDHISNALSSVIETKVFEQSLPSALRVAMDCINDIDNSQNPIHNHVTHSEVVVENAKDIPDDDALQIHELDLVSVPPPKKQRIETINNADCNNDIDSVIIQSATNNIQTDECEEVESVADIMQLEDEDFGAMDDDGSNEESLPTRNSNATDNFMSGIRINLIPGKPRRQFTSGNGKMRLNIGKRAVTPDTRFVYCSYQGCCSRLLLRHGYGRDRLINHARTHLTSTASKCSHCSYVTNSDITVRSHHYAKHRDIKWTAPLKEETAGDIENLIKIFNKCFPGWVRYVQDKLKNGAKFNIGHSNLGNEHQRKHVNLEGTTRQKK